MNENTFGNEQPSRDKVNLSHYSLIKKKKKMPRDKYNKISQTDRGRIIKAHEEGKNWRETATSLNINIRTAYEWIKNNQTLPKKRGGCKGTKKKKKLWKLTKRYQDG